ncbi:MAG: hypothetical protein AB7P40_17155 [Chloroflexota bacterium]
MSEATPDEAPQDQATAQVDAILSRAGLPVTPQERERLIRLYPSFAQRLAGLRVPEARYAEPALIYPATFER